MKSEPAPIFSEIESLSRYVSDRSPARVVLTNGCFDPLHVGHVRFLAGAKVCGDFLVAALHDDDSTRSLKGEGRPVVGELARARVLAGLDAVDAVLLFGEPDVTAILTSLRPACHANGTDFTVDTVPELETSKRLGVETVIVGDTKSHASTDVVRWIRKNAEPKGDE